MTTFADYNIHIDPGLTGNIKTTCPECSAERKKNSEPCLSVNIDMGVWNCHHCGWKGSLGKSNGSKNSSIVDTYDYLDETGNVLYQKLRFFPKRFSFRKPDGKSGWIDKLGNIRRVPYRLPELIASKKEVFIVEGEKDVDNLMGIGLTATCNPMGAGKWRKEYNQHLKGREVVILEDKDQPGQKHGKKVSESLLGIAKSIKILRFPELPKGGDVSDFLENRSLDDLNDLIKNAPLFTGNYAEDFGENPSSELEQSEPEEPDKRPSQSKILIALAIDCELFHSPDGEVWVTVPQAGHRETWCIQSKGFKRWLRRRFYFQTDKAPNNQAMSEALGLLEARAQYDGSQIPVYRRLAEHEGRTYLDLCNEKWQAIEIDADGWRVIDNPPVKFIRAKGMEELPIPEGGGSINDLRPFLNIGDEDSWILTMAYIAGTIRYRGPFPIFILQGEQGSSKSTFARIIRALVDPSTAPLRTRPREERDLMIAASNAWILAFDNLSGLSAGLSDSLCRLATGGGFSTRALYTDSEEVLFDAQRPIILNGIDEIANRDDLRDRSLIISLPTIPEHKRRDEGAFWRQFDETKPKILGAFLDAVSAGIRNFPSIELERSPRMADFAKWATACESGFGLKPGAFMDAYTINRTHAVEMGIESDLVGQAILSMMETCPEWEGTAADLLDFLEKEISDKLSRSKAWPKVPNALSNRLNRLAPTLRQIGVEVERYREGNTRRRVVRIYKINEKTVPTVPTVPTVREGANPSEKKELNSGDQGDDMRTMPDNSKDSSSADNPLNLNTKDDADDMDDDFRPPTDPESGGLWDVSI